MPRRQMLKVVSHPAYVAGCLYRLRIREIRIDRRRGVLGVTLEHLGEDQEGRVQQVMLPLPVRPAGRAAAFFRACGMEVSIDANIVPEDALGKVIAAQFEPLDGPDDWRPDSFFPVDKEAGNEPESR